ncbi:MAG: hypothetical protein ABI181_13820 [Mycobacteriaceae bacterium]
MLASLVIFLCVVVAVVVIVRRGLRRGTIRRVHSGPRFAVGRKARDAARED